MGDIRDAFEAFVKEHPNGKMKPKDFRQLISSALPKKDASKMEKHVFRIYDANNDGYVDFVEFMVVYTIMAGGTEEEVLTKIFRLFDVNSDGVISKKEMSRLVKDMYSLKEFSTACLAEKDFSRLLTSTALDIFMEEEMEEKTA